MLSGKSCCAKETALDNPKIKKSFSMTLPNLKEQYATRVSLVTVKKRIKYK
jgi:hypothetical protein